MTKWVQLSQNILQLDSCGIWLMKSGLKVDGFFENFAFFNFFYISKDKFLHKGLEPAKINRYWSNMGYFEWHGEVRLHINIF